MVADILPNSLNPSLFEGLSAMLEKGQNNLDVGLPDILSAPFEGLLILEKPAKHLADASIGVLGSEQIGGPQAGAAKGEEVTFQGVEIRPLLMGHAGGIEQDGPWSKGLGPPVDDHMNNPSHGRYQLVEGMGMRLHSPSGIRENMPDVMDLSGFH